MYMYICTCIYIYAFRRVQEKAVRLVYTNKKPLKNFTTDHFFNNVCIFNLYYFVCLMRIRILIIIMDIYLLK